MQICRPFDDTSLYSENTTYLYNDGNGKVGKVGMTVWRNPRLAVSSECGGGREGGGGELIYMYSEMCDVIFGKQLT